MHGASPSSTLTDPAPHHQHQQHQAQGIYAPDFAQSGLAGGSYAYVNPRPITDILMLDAREAGVDQAQMDMMPTWLEFLPDDVLSSLYDPSMNGGNHQGGHMG